MVPEETSEAPATPQKRPRRKKIRKPHFLYILGYYITPTSCVQRLLNVGISVTGERPSDLPGRAFVRVCRRLSAIGFPIGGRRFIDIELPSASGYLLILSTTYVKDEVPDIDEELKNKVKEARNQRCIESSGDQECTYTKLNWTVNDAVHDGLFLSPPACLKQ
ncbi:hypothetical protein M413DRAFT_31566 [Hebeloma cylindrosporum]|uniref:Uncharacterized protein n=1 Tax=Hebeloma cylindrosporum TaxID=76867 RepID=A0A0C2XEZ4_HEBCY|nr:hypothetical protein M413DRAFT_31566 [Hebeloma cylindrosporum h7]